MENLHLLQYVAIGVLFCWSGFVRSGLGFGGAVLVLPFLLLIVDDPLVFVPLIAVHMLVFGVWISLRGVLAQRASADGAPTSMVDWTYLARAMPWIVPSGLIGILGLLTLPPRVMSLIVFVIVIAYSISYVLARPIRSYGPKTDALLLALGGYITGSSLIGGPLMVAVFSSHVSRSHLRDTLLAAWVVLVVMKLASFIAVGVDLQFVHHLWLFPCVLAGHIAGERLHRRMLRAHPTRFFRWLGAVLLGVSLFGIWWSLR